MMLLVGAVVIVMCCVVGVVLGLAQYALSVGKQSRKKGEEYEAATRDGDLYRRATDGPRWVDS